MNPLRRKSIFLATTAAITLGSRWFSPAGCASLAPSPIERLAFIRNAYLDHLKSFEARTIEQKPAMAQVAQFQNFPNFPNFNNFPNFPNFSNFLSGATFDPC